MDTSKATARPWATSAVTEADGSTIWDVCAADAGDMIADLKGLDNAEADAALIVRAVNSHEALVAALRDLLDGSEPWDVRATQARAALALAEQGGG